ncbi:ArsR/SmtB family transcription factor [Streptomyces tailanensis]|uniref:ArsR/SmtB family transcription factor n=1 Tax=Streptomyces tailanensis TaxID=2569858 RepID=UPI002483057C|nr:winged helix-turn-helix domain-containing protein [Streptomyces tailanensis]
MAIIDRLVLGDASPGELGRELGLPSNLLAHHLKVLDQVGLVERSRSEGELFVGVVADGDHEVVGARGPWAVAVRSTYCRAWPARSQSSRRS